MLNLEPRNETRVQTPEENNKILFLNEEGEVVLKNDANEIEPLSAGGGASYLVYTALLTQSGTDAPVATVLENTLGQEVVWIRREPGRYETTIENTHPDSIIIPYPNNVDIAENDYITSLYNLGDDGDGNVILRYQTCWLTFDGSGRLVTESDGFSIPQLIEIRVYP